MSENRMSDIIKASLEGVRDFTGVDTVIGNAINTQSGVTVIPVSKITTFTLGGGGEYGDVKLFSKNSSHPFAGGSGALVNVTPTGFLIKSGTKFSFIKSNEDVYDKITDKAFDILGGLNNEN